MVPGSSQCCVVACKIPGGSLLPRCRRAGRADLWSFPLQQVIELRRPLDSRLEHVDFESLFTSLSVRHLSRVFASLLLERRVIFIADKLRYPLAFP